jgi:excisionase family DNA binding protein
MRTDHPLTLTVEQAGQVLGVGRSTAYELVRSGDLKSIRLRRRIVVPVAHLAESLGVDRDTVWATLTATDAKPASPPAVVASTDTTARRGRTTASEISTLF